MARRSARKAAGSGSLRRPEPTSPVQPGRRPSRLVLIVVTALVAAAGAAGGLLLTSGAQPHRQAAVAHGKAIDWSSVPQLQTGASPWPSESGLLARRLKSSGLDALSMEGTVLHHHEHLDLFVNGHPVTVPALVGIGPAFLTELHTHDSSGIIHVESPVQRSFRLGQFFCEWGVKLSANCLGRYRGELSWWVNGRRMHGNPALLPLRQQQEIVIAAGRPPTTVPASYDFPAGL